MAHGSMSTYYSEYRLLGIEVSDLTSDKGTAKLRSCTGARRSRVELEA